MNDHTRLHSQTCTTYGCQSVGAHIAFAAVWLLGVGCARGASLSGACGISEASYPKLVCASQEHVNGATVLDDAYTLAASPDAAWPAETIDVCWTAPEGGTSSSDWIGLYRPGAPNTEYLDYRYANGDLSGCVTFVARREPGPYEFRYILSGWPYIDVATSNEITVLCGNDAECDDGDPCTSDLCVENLCQYTALEPCYTLEACPDDVAPEATIIVCWTAPEGGTSPTDWIGLYRPGAPNNEYLDYRYANGELGGCVTFVARREPGPYEFRYILSGWPYIDVATSNEVSVRDEGAPGPDGCPCLSDEHCDDRNPYTTDACVENVCQNTPLEPWYTLDACPDDVAPVATIIVCWTAPEDGTSPYDWIGLYRVGDPNGTYLCWFYTEGEPSGCSTACSAPHGPGTYEFRYLPDNGYVDVATSNEVRVHHRDECVICGDGCCDIDEDSFDCPQDCGCMGACCLQDDTCTDGMEEHECIASGGRYLGDGLTCHGDPDEDGVIGCDDVCPDTRAPAGVDPVGRPRGDLNEDCDVDLRDFAIMQNNFTGPKGR